MLFRHISVVFEVCTLLASSLTSSGVQHTVILLVNGTIT